MEELTRAEGTPEDARMEVLLIDPDLCILDKEVDMNILRISALNPT